MNKITIIGDLINSAYGRARKAWQNKDLSAYQKLALSQVEWGSAFLDVNIDSTKSDNVKHQEMLDFLPDLIPALQSVTNIPLCFDNPSAEFQKVAFQHYNSQISGDAILNSIGPSRKNIPLFLDIIKEYKPYVLVVISELLVKENEVKPCESPHEILQSAYYFLELLNNKCSLPVNKIIFDPGLPPVSADTQGIVNMGLDSMKMIRENNEFKGVGISVGLSNFSWGIPKEFRPLFERAYLNIASKYGLNYAIANPEHNPIPLDDSDEITIKLKQALEFGRPTNEISQMESGYMQAEAILSIVSNDDSDDF